jgi:hypothetical protein
MTAPVHPRANDELVVTIVLDYGREEILDIIQTHDEGPRRARLSKMEAAVVLADLVQAANR